jgi:cation:H+ antiporter
MNIFLLLLGLLVLIASGEVLVRSAAGIALKAAISPMIVGLTIVSIGTSAPELFASISAAINGSPGLALGNVIGSNIANITLVLGITALIYPIPVYRGMLYFDVSIMVGISLLTILLGRDAYLSRLDGIILLVAIVAFTITLIFRSRQAKRRAAEVTALAHEQNADHGLQAEEEVKDLATYSTKGYPYLIGLVLVGCIGLYFGAEWFVGGAKGIAQSLEISDYIIGVTVVAFGTSVPELVASIIASLRRQTDISIGNLIGSNIFNLGLVLGSTATISPLDVDSKILSSDFWWMLGVAALLFPLILTGFKIKRWEGALLIACYGSYLFMTLK